MRYIQQLVGNPDFEHFFPAARQIILCLAKYENAYLTNDMSYFRQHTPLKPVFLAMSNPFLSLPHNPKLYTLLSNVGKWSVEKKLFDSLEKFGDFMYLPFYSTEKNLIMGRIFEQIAAEICAHKSKIKLCAVKIA